MLLFHLLEAPAVQGNENMIARPNASVAGRTEKIDGQKHRIRIEQGEEDVLRPRHFNPVDPVGHVVKPRKERVGEIADGAELGISRGQVSENRRAFVNRPICLAEVGEKRRNENKIDQDGEKRTKRDAEAGSE
jgi:hypothetical protein